MSGRILFSWLHLSDMHVGHGSARYKVDQKQVWRLLNGDITRLLADRRVPRPEAIFVTGDVAFSGTTDQYRQAGDDLRELGRQTRVETTAIFTVPGNHDVQRTAGSDPFNITLKGLREGVSVDEALADPEHERQLRTRFQNYIAFAGQFGSHGIDTYWTRTLKPKNLRLRILGLNTAILSNDDQDQGKLALGLRQIEKTLGNSAHEFVIALTHHPLSGWLRDGDGVETRLRALGVNVHLSGHVHTQKSYATWIGGGPELLQISAGAVHTDEQGADGVGGHGYNFGALVLTPDDHLEVQMWPRLWSPRHQDFRVDPDNIDPTDASTRRRLPIRDLEKLLVPRRRHVPPPGEGFVFEVDDLAPVVDAIDTETTRRLQAVEEFLDSVAGRFSSLFLLDEHGMKRHPLFVDLQGTLDSLVPGVVMNEHDGVLLRAGTRHAILRAETMHVVLRAVDHDRLDAMACSIGNDAASDLIQNVLENHKYIPATAEAFVALWDFWDRTGGWGKLQLRHSDADEESGVWRLAVLNNFLEVQTERRRTKSDAPPELLRSARQADLNATHSLCEFWCGYIRGFLGTALPRIRRLMLGRAIASSQSVFVPPFTTINAVQHIGAGDDSLTTDVFEIRFQIDPLSIPLIQLSRALRSRLANDPTGAVACAAEAVQSAAGEFREAVNEILESLPSVDLRRARLEKMTMGFPYNFAQKGTVEEWIEDANWLIQGLAK